MIDAAWTYMDNSGMNAPPEDSETGYSVPVLTWMTDTPDDLDSGEYWLQVARLDEDGRACGWMAFVGSGDYDVMGISSLSNPTAWIVRPMDTEERERTARSG